MNTENKCKIVEKSPIIKKYSYSRDELIKEVENETEVGKRIVEVYMSYLRSFKEGLYAKK